MSTIGQRPNLPGATVSCARVIVLLSRPAGDAAHTGWRHPAGSGQRKEDKRSRVTAGPAAPVARDPSVLV